MKDFGDYPVPARLAAFGTGLVLVFAAALGVGVLTGDVSTAAPAGSMSDGMTDGTSDDEHSPQPVGLGTQLSEGDLRLEAPTTVLPAGTRTPFTFRVLNGEQVVTDFDLEQTKRAHLLLVDRDLSRYAHLHPALAPDGTFSLPLTADPGSYRVLVDVTVGGTRHVLATDLTVPGELRAVPLPAPSTRVTVDGYDVGLTRQGEDVTFSVTRDGAPVELEPYLGAQAHAVALRAGDLAYTHVHAVDGLRFSGRLPGPGTYRLFLEFSVGGTVRTAAFTVIEEA